LKYPEPARQFAVMAQNAAGSAPNLPAATDAVQEDIANAFRVSNWST